MPHFRVTMENRATKTIVVLPYCLGVCERVFVCLCVYFFLYCSVMEVQ